MHDLPALWLAAFPLMGSPGPATLSLAAIGTAFGFSAGRSYLLGIIVGTTIVLLLIASGVTALILADPALVTVLTVVAALYILYLAWRIATSPVGARKAQAEAAPGFVPGLVLAAANPKAFAAIGAVYASHNLVEGDVVRDAALKILALAAVIVVVNTIWLGFGSAFSRMLTHAVLGRAANIVFALMLLASLALALVPH
ncbi:MAG: LysE family transporter [Pseudomonadota bacterium]